MKNLILVFVLIFSAFHMKGECKLRQGRNEQAAVAQAKQVLLSNRLRSNLINYLIAKNGYKSYLEIGVADGVNLSLVKAEYKVGVDPCSTAPCQCHMTSDEFFEKNTEMFDIVFIDGLHLHEQVLKDVENSLKCLNPGGVIVMHDCMPPAEQYQVRSPIPPGAWNGDVWRAAAYIRMHYSHVHFCVLAMDEGCGVLTPGHTQMLFPAVPLENMDWNFYAQNRDRLLNLKSVEGWLMETDKGIYR